MSRSLMLKTLGACAVAFAIGMSAMALHLRRNTPGSLTQASLDPAQQRRLATIADGKRALLMGKHLSVVQVSVRAPDGIPAHEGQEVTLVGWVRLNQPVNQDLRFRWDLPEGVHVVEGQLEDSWANVRAGQTAETRLTVVGFSQETLRMVALNGYVMEGETQMGTSAVLTSRPDDSYEMLSSAPNNAGAEKMSASSTDESARPVRAPLQGAIQR